MGAREPEYAAGGRFAAYGETTGITGTGYGLAGVVYEPAIGLPAEEPIRLAQMFKRVMDVLLALGALLALAPLLAVIALAVKFSSPGPVFFLQERCGRGGKRFRIVKFRSMVDGAHQQRGRLEPFNEVDGPVFKMRDDPRCTRLGQWLRRYSLDELPQLWNIVRGEMSFVGPRPPLPEEVEKYEAWHMRRLAVTPGLTCLWVLEGRSRLNFDIWVLTDVQYIEGWSLWLDCKILLLTLPVVMRGHGAC